MELLTTLTHAIKERLRYVARTNEGTQTPVETLAKRDGTCRDYALLMLETCARWASPPEFVTGYLYDLRSTAAPPGPRVPAPTHAWVQVYLPGAGWVEFDPTNGIVGGRNLIRVGVARDPKQAVPLAGSFVGGETTIWAWRWRCRSPGSRASRRSGISKGSLAPSRR